MPAFLSYNMNKRLNYNGSVYKRWFKILKSYVLVTILGIVFLCGCAKSVPIASDQGSRTLPLPDPEQITVPKRTATIPEELTSQPSMTVTVTPELCATPTLIKISQDSLWLQSKSYPVPMMSQAGLKYKGIETKLGCTAASIQMILDYWKSVDSENKRLSAQRIIDINTSQGTFHAGTGLSVENVVDELELLGYRAEIYRNGDKLALLKAFHENGPQALLVKTEWIPQGANHLAVLVAYDQEADTVTINDPWYDYTVTWDWDAFDGIWSLNYSVNKDGFLNRVFVNIVPENFTSNQNQ